MIDLFLMLFRYQLFHTPADGMCPRSDQTESRMLEEHHCVKEVTEEYTFQGYNFSCLGHICTAGA